MATGSVYSTALTVNQKTSQLLDVTEDVRYGTGGKPPRVGGVRLVFQILTADTLKAFDFAWVTNTADATSLHQLGDISYGGVVTGHVQIDCDTPPDVDGVPPLSANAWWDDPVNAPASFDVQLLA